MKKKENNSVQHKSAFITNHTREKKIREYFKAPRALIKVHCYRKHLSKLLKVILKAVKPPIAL